MSKARQIVDEFLEHAYEPGMTEDYLWMKYTMFGEDPFIVGEEVPERFSAWDYAKERCKDICEKNEG